LPQQHSLTGSPVEGRDTSNETEISQRRRRRDRFLFQPS